MMKSGKTDHRVRLTRQIIKESLILLMKENPISRISVKMLCDTADINRSTFYAHYTDTSDLLNQIQSEVISNLAEYISQNELSEPSLYTRQLLQKILEYVKENSELLKALLSENGDYTFQKGIMILAQKKLIDNLKNMKNTGPRTIEYLQIFVVTGALTVVQKWLSDGMLESTEEMADLCSRLLYTGLSEFNVR